jgi:lipopolysaccharide export system permease protein
MKLYTKYIITSLVMPVIVLTLTLTSIVWLTQSLRFIDLIINKGLDITTFLYLSFLLLPSLLMIILPVAIFVSVLTVYNKLMSDSELIVLTSTGLSKMELAKPALIVASFIAIFGYLVSFYLLPTSYREFKDTQAFIKNNYTSLLLQEGVFSTPTKDLTVYIENRGRQGLLHGILVHDSRDPEKPTTIMAQEGKLVSTAKGPRFDLKNGHIQQLDKLTGNLNIVDFESDQYDLSLYTQAGEEHPRTPEEKYIHELIFSKNTDEKLVGKYLAEGHYRVSWPLYTILLTLIAVTALFSGQFNRRGQWKRIFCATSIALIIILTNLSLKHIAESKPIFCVFMYLNAILPSCICIHMMTNNSKLNEITIFEKLLKRLRSTNLKKKEALF